MRLRKKQTNIHHFPVLFVFKMISPLFFSSLIFSKNFFLKINLGKEDKRDEKSLKKDLIVLITQSFLIFSQKEKNSNFPFRFWVLEKCNFYINSFYRFQKLCRQRKFTHPSAQTFTHRETYRLITVVLLN